MNIPQKHTNGSTWVFSYAGADGHGKRHWQWSCINADNSVDVYPCCENGWIDYETHKPKVIGTMAVVFDRLGSWQEAEEWAFHEDGNCWFDIACDSVSHWRPQMGNPV